MQLNHNALYRLGFDSWDAYVQYLIDRPLKERWYKWNIHYRIRLRVMIKEAKAGRFACI